MVVTQDDEVAARLRSFRSHGMTTLTWQRHRGHASLVRRGRRGTQLPPRRGACRLALVQLRRLRTRTRKKESGRAIASSSIPWTSRRLRCRGHEHSSHHLAVAVLAPEVDRDRDARMVSSRRGCRRAYYPPIHLLVLRGARPAPSAARHRRGLGPNRHASALPAHDRGAGRARRTVSRGPPRWSVGRSPPGRHHRRSRRRATLAVRAPVTRVLPIAISSGLASPARDPRL